MTTGFMKLYHAAKTATLEPCTDVNKDASEISAKAHSARRRTLQHRPRLVWHAKGGAACGLSRPVARNGGPAGAVPGKVAIGLWPESHHRPGKSVCDSAVQSRNTIGIPGRPADLSCKGGGGGGVFNPDCRGAVPELVRMGAISVRLWAAIEGRKVGYPRAMAGLPPSRQRRNGTVGKRRSVRQATGISVWKIAASPLATINESALLSVVFPISGNNSGLVSWTRGQMPPNW